MSHSTPSGKVARTSATLDRVLLYRNNEVVLRIAKELKCSKAKAQGVFTDTLRFLWLAATFGKIAPSTLIDEGWHTFIMFTMDYQKFCYRYFGRFLHHRPNRSTDKPSDGRLLRRTMMLIQEHFGDVVRTSKNWEYEKVPCQGGGDCKSACNTKCCGSCS